MNDNGWRDISWRTASAGDVIGVETVDGRRFFGTVTESADGSITAVTCPLPACTDGLDGEQGSAVDLEVTS